MRPQAWKVQYQCNGRVIQRTSSSFKSKISTPGSVLDDPILPEHESVRAYRIDNEGSKKAGLPVLHP